MHQHRDKRMNLAVKTYAIMEAVALTPAQIAKLNATDWPTWASVVDALGSACDWVGKIAVLTKLKSAWKVIKRGVGAVYSAVKTGLKAIGKGITDFLKSLGHLSVSGAADCPSDIPDTDATNACAQDATLDEVGATLKAATASPPGAAADDGSMVSYTDAQWDTTEARRAAYGPKIAGYGVSIAKLAGATLSKPATAAFSYVMFGLDTAASFCSLAKDYQKAFIKTAGVSADAIRQNICKFRRRQVDIVVGLIIGSVGVAVTAGSLGGAAAVVMPIMSMVWGMYKMARDEEGILDPCGAAGTTFRNASPKWVKKIFGWAPTTLANADTTAVDDSASLSS